MVDPKQLLLPLRGGRHARGPAAQPEPAELASADLAPEAVAALHERSIHSVQEVLALDWLDRHQGSRFVEELGLLPDEIRRLEAILRATPGGAAEIESWEEWGRRAYTRGYDVEREDSGHFFDPHAAAAPTDGPAGLATAAPGTVNLVPQMPPIKHQGSRNSCVAFVAAACLEHYIARTRQIATDFSEQFILWDVLTRVGERTLGAAFPLLASDGACLESTWPYRNVEDPNNPAQGPPPPPASGEASTYRCSTVQYLTNLDLVRQRLAAGVPVGIGVVAYASWWDNPVVRQYGNIGMPQDGEVPLAMGHAMTLVGYAPHPGYPGGGFFLVRNSFGRDWGRDSPFEAGHGTIPYEYVRRYTQRAVWCIAA